MEVKKYLFEEWRDVKGYEGLYQVSNFGRVKILDRFVKNKYGKRLIKGYITEGRIRNGYRIVTFTGKKDKLMHILVAQAFPEICGEWFEGCQVHHRNFNGLDNRPENLIVLTPSEHSKLHYERQTDDFKKPSEKRSKSISKALTGKPSPKRIPIVQLSLDMTPIFIWESITEAGEVLGVYPGNICSCCKGKLKTAYKFVWQYLN